VGKEGAGSTDVVDVDEGARRCLVLGLFQQGVELGDAGRGAGGERAGRDRVDADTLRAEFGGDVLGRGLERGLGDCP
jgi:hypothetical protein